MGTEPHIQLFISCVSAEFRSYREALRKGLARHNVTIHIQEDFSPAGVPTLDKLNDYIKGCDAVIHLAGDMTGALANPYSLEAMKGRYSDLGERLPPLKSAIETGSPEFSYTQWEAYLAIYHRKKLIIAEPFDTAPREKTYKNDTKQVAARRTHLERLAELNRHPEIMFVTEDKLVNGVLRALIDIFPREPERRAKPINLPYSSLGSLFKGRDEFVADLRASLEQSKSGNAAIVGKAVHGLGGVGKTRLAVEYAWQYEADYTALLFAVAEARPEPTLASAEEAPAQTPSVDLRRNLAALADPLILNLPQQAVPEEERRAIAVVDWLREHPGWLLIIDNADSEQSATEVEKFLPQLRGGHVLITSRRRNWSRQIERKELGVLPAEAAEAFLLESTANSRRVEVDDAAQATTLAQELGHLALAMEQAAAYIDQHHLNLAGYLKSWQNNRDSVASWFDPQTMNYPMSVAVTWQTSVVRLKREARTLLDRLAFLSPEPVPASLLDVVVPGVRAGNQHDALAELNAYSMVAWAKDAPAFTVHRLVQDVTRRNLKNHKYNAVLTDTLDWMDAILNHIALDEGNLTFPDSIIPHVRSVAAHGDGARIFEPSRRLWSRLNDANQKEYLLRVQSHNIRNVLQLIQGLCRMLAQRSSDIAQFEARFRGCVQAIAVCHALFMQHDWRGATLGELLRTQLGTFGRLDGIEIAASGPEIYLLSQATQSLGLIIHELATNAIKHGALSVPGGSVVIEWTQDSSSQEVRLTWKESGGPPVEVPQRKGFGLVVFERIGGSLGDTSIDFRREGISCLVTIRAANLHRSDSLALWPHRFNAKPE